MVDGAKNGGAGAEAGEEGRFAGEHGTVGAVPQSERSFEAVFKERNQQALLFEAMEQSAESIAITNTDGIVEYVNAGFERSTGYRRVEVLGRRLNLLKSGHQHDAFYSRMWQTIKSGKVWKGTFVNRRKDGKLIHEDAVITPVRGTDGAIRHFVSVKHDITREIELEQQLRQSQKMESIGLLAGGVAHDFNNILTVVLSNAKMVKDALADDDVLQEEIGDIIEAVQRGGDLTRQLLTFSRKQVLRPVSLDLSETVQGMQKMLRRLVSERYGLDLVLNPEPLPVFVDRGAIEQVLMNLVVNARDAMPEGGRIEVETLMRPLCREGTEVFADFVVQEPEAMVCVSVRDAGKGIAPDDMERIFEPFFTTKAAGAGSGLGLSTVFGIVKQHHGLLSVESAAGVGSCFRVYLPLAESPASSEKTEGAKAALKRRQGETIFLVEDDPAVRQVTRKLMTGLGFYVFEAANAEEALEMISQVSQIPDLLLTDVVMPGMNGFDLYREMVARFPGLRVLYTSGYPESHLKGMGYDSSRMRFVRKPFEENHLLRMIHEVLDEEEAG